MRRWSSISLLALIIAGGACDKGTTLGPPQAVMVQVSVPLSDVQGWPGVATVQGFGPLEITLRLAGSGEIVHIDSLPLSNATQVETRVTLLIGPAGEDFVLSAVATSPNAMPIRYGPATVHIAQTGTAHFSLPLHSDFAGITRIDHEPYSLALSPQQSSGVSVTVRDSLGNVIQPVVQFVSANPQIADVNASGVVTAGSVSGQTAIRITVAGSPLRDSIVVSNTQPSDRFVDIAAAFRGACGLTSAGSVYCWGQGRDVPTRLAELPAMRAIWGGNATMCGVTTTAQTYCWQMSLTSITSYQVPTSLAFTSITQSNSSTGECGLVAGGDVYCWEGTGAPVRMSSPIAAAAIAGSDHPFCALSADGTAYCKKIDYNSTDSLVALRNAKFTSIAGDDRSSMCGARIDGVPVCWGFFETSWGADQYYLSRSPCGSLVCDQPTPLDGNVRLSSSFTAGENVFCGLDIAGKAYCWGDNDRGALGVGTERGPQLCSDFACSVVPVPVRTQYAFTKIVAAVYHVCGITKEGQTLCWGDGNASITTSRLDRAPIPVSGVRN